MNLLKGQTYSIEKVFDVCIHTYLQYMYEHLKYVVV